MSDYLPDQEAISEAPALNQDAWNQVGIYLNPDQSVNMAKSLFYIARYLTQRGHATPKQFIGKPYQNSWWGPEEFSAGDIENYFLKFDIEVNHKTVRDTLGALVRKGQIERVGRNNFRASTTML